MGLRDGLFSLNSVTPKIMSGAAIAPLSDLNALPMANYQFTVKINDQIVGLFQRIGGISVRRNVDEYQEGGFNEYTYEFPRELSYNHITLERGLTSSDFFFKWMMFGKEQGYVISRTIVLEQRFPGLDAPPPKTWRFDGAFPVRWALSDLSVTNTNAIAVETLEISFNFFELEE